MNLEQRTMEILHLLADPERFKKRLDQLQSQIDQAQSTIALVGPAQDIIRVREKIEADRVEIAEEKESMDAKRKGIVQEAESNAQEIVESAQMQAADLIGSADVKLKDANQRHALAQKHVVESQRVEAELVLREKRLTKDLLQFKLKQDEVAELEQSLLKEKSELAAVRDTLRFI